MGTIETPPFPPIYVRGNATAQYTEASIRLGEYIRQHIEGDFKYMWEFTDYVKKLDEWYMSFESPSNPPFAVKRAIVLKFADNLPLARKILQDLGYDGLMKCWFFTWAGMFCGVEPDGYILRTKTIGNHHFVYAKIGDWYGWYELTPVEIPEDVCPSPK